jgi:hypothetical protein
MPFLTIYFHKDFDGFVATALFMRINEHSQLIGAETVTFKPVDYELKKFWLKTDLDKPNVVIDFLYHPQADWWFDHHTSTFIKESHKIKYQNSEKQFWDVNSPSCADLIKKNLFSLSSLFFTHEEFCTIVDEFKEWIYWCDIIDNAKYENPAQIIELNNPCLQINATINSDIDEEYLRSLILAAKMYTPADVVQMSFIKPKIDLVMQLQGKFKQIFKQNYEFIKDGIVLFDYVKHKIPFQRYMTYYYEPKAKYSIGLYPRSGQYAISVGKNPWFEFDSKDLGIICQEYGGGGRIHVGSILTKTYPNAIKCISQICNTLSI